jgi:general secretion pathway protein L
MNYLIVQLSAGEAIFARFVAKGKELVFTGASRHPLDADHPFVSLLPQIKTESVAEEKIVLAIPPALLYLREVELPITDRRKLREVLPLEMKGETALDTDELIFDALPLEAGKVLAVWARQADIAEEIRIMAEHGLEPEIITASLFQWQEIMPAGTGGETVALTDGEALAVYADGAPVYFRRLGRGELAAETTKTLAALEISRGIRVGTVFLHGSAAREWPAESSGETHAGISFAPLPVSGDFAAMFSTDRSAALDLAGACALAKACIREEPVNFRRGDLTYTAGLQKLRRKLRLTACLAAALFLLLTTEVGIRYYFVARDLSSLDNSIQTMFRQVFPSRKKSADAVAELRAEIKRLGGGAAGQPILPILKKLAELKGSDITGFYETEIDGGQLRLKGDARSVQAVNDFRARAATAFTGADVGEIKTRADGSVSFAFMATVKEEKK